ncbi:hypothetical protein B9Z19DRAFT_972686, partial [Tuber borchii]
YRVQVKVLLFNHSDVDFAVIEGNCVAQLILKRIVTPEVVDVDQLDEAATVEDMAGSEALALESH